MFSRFYPKKYVRSTYAINYKKYYNKGFRGVLFDVDNTLVAHGAPPNDKAIDFFEKLRKIGFQTCLISNNKEERVKPFADAVKSPYIFDAHKPATKSYIDAMEIMGTEMGNTLFVGDQVFTDVYGGNRANMYTILVRPIHPKEEIQIVLKRKLEKIVLRSYKLRGRGIKREERRLLKEEKKKAKLEKR